MLLQIAENHYIFRADQMPSPPREVQLTNDFFLDMSCVHASSCISKHQAVHTHNSVLSSLLLLV